MLFTISSVVCNYIRSYPRTRPHGYLSPSCRQYRLQHCKFKLLDDTPLRNFRYLRDVKMKFRLIIISIIAALLAGCSATKHVPDGEYLLNSVKINITDDSGVTPASLVNYLRQQPNHKVLGFAKLSLGIYNLSGKDEKKWYNRWIRSIGQEPVIYDASLADASRRQLNLALINRGYNASTVSVDSVYDVAKKKIDLVYNVTPGKPHVIATMNYVFDDPGLGEVIMRDSARFTIGPGSPLNRDLLENEIAQISSRLRDKGYYTFSKDYITFIADTLAGSNEVDLTMRVRSSLSTTSAADSFHNPGRRYIIERVKFIIEAPDGSQTSTPHIENVKGYTFVYGNDRYLRPGFLEEKCYIRPGEAYNGSDVNRTYESFSQLPIVKYVNITMNPLATDGETGFLEAVITISRNKKQGISAEIEGTNSEGDLGFGVGLTYQNRNLAHGAELLTAKFRGSYESLSGNLEGFINDRYTEFSGEAGITFPRFEAPFMSRSFKRRIRANTEVTLSMNYQERPEYTRIISGVAWKYRWSSPRNTWRHTFDLIDLNLVYLPRSTENFINNIAPTNPLLRYSYEDHLIMRLGYSYYRSNRRPISVGRLTPQTFQPEIWTFRVSAETAGNILNAISHIVGQKKHDGAYKVFGVQYSQYVKAETDYTHVFNLNHRNSIALHGEFGIAVPYGNSRMVPFEKRFYAGGANSVRGWGVRTLGPGDYDTRNSVTDFINQCGDISLECSIEYRAKLFWVIEGALFIDAGNIWTIRNYETQPGGVFRFNKFYKQIALAYGAGVRFDFTYFLLRLDLGMKAHNPAMNQQPWPLIHPRWHRDHTLHLSIGYPF